MALALLGKFDGVENWGEYADALRDCAADILAQAEAGEILPVGSWHEFEVEASGDHLCEVAADYRGGMMAAKYYLRLMAGLFGAYVGASKQDPQSNAGLKKELGEMEARITRQIQSGDQATRGHVTKELSPVKTDVHELSGHVLEDTGKTKIYFAASPTAQAIFTREAKRILREHIEKTGNIPGVNAAARLLSAIEWRKVGWPNDVRLIGQESFRKRVSAIIEEFTRAHGRHIGKMRRR